MNRISIRHRAASGIAVIALILTAPPVQAQFGGIVYDPSNYAQNVLTAARALQQINHQIQSLQNQATSLINQAKNLASLPFSSLATLQAQVRQTQQLLGQAQRLAFNIDQIEQAFTAKYKGASLTASDQTLINGAQDRWENSVAAFEDALKVQAGVVGNIDGARSTMNSLVTASQSATGALQAAQAGNQLLALQSQQLSDLTAVLAAQGRAQALESAQRAAAQAQGREQLRRFLTPGTGYQPGNATMFHN
jgi:P-type conjugative transfer protein TrbJ